MTGNGLPSSSRRANCAITGGMILRRPASSRSFSAQRSSTPSSNRPLSSTWTCPRANRTGDPWNRKPTSCIVTVPLSKTNRPVTSSIAQLERGAGLGARPHRAVELQQDPVSGSGVISRW